MNYATDGARKRIDWTQVLLIYLDNDLSEEFKIWCQRHRKIKSDNKKAFCFLLKKYGRSWIRFVRSSGGAEGLIRVLKTQWIKKDEE